MPRIWKEVFRAGKYTDHRGVKHTFTPAHVQDTHTNAQNLLKLQHPWTAPAIWEHDWSETPVPISTMLSTYATDRAKRAETVKERFGHIVDTKIQDSKGVKTLWAELEIPDYQDYEQFKKVGFVSPRIDFDATDSQGRVFKGASIFHIAATNRPIQIDQSPVMLSAMPGGWKSKQSIVLSEIDMAKEDENVIGEGAGDDMSQLKSVLAELGHPIPEEVTEMKELILVLKAESMRSDDNEEPETGEGEPGTGDVSTTSVSPAMLSALPAEVRGLVETGRNALAVATANQRDQLLARMAKVEGRAVESGMATVAEMQNLKKRLTSVQLSFSGDGKLNRTKAIQELELFEKMLGKAKAKNPEVKPKTKSVSLSSFGGGAPAGVNDEEFTEQCRRASEAAQIRMGFKTKDETAKK